MSLIRIANARCERGRCAFSAGDARAFVISSSESANRLSFTRSSEADCRPARMTEVDFALGGDQPTLPPRRH